MLLLHDTLVTNHGFAGGVATPIVSVLQAGTAVLVDPTGLPVVRCACGNPLTAPPAVDLSTATLQGARWDEFDVGRTLVVTGGAAVSQLVVVDVSTGDDLTLSVGAPAAPATTSSPPAVVTTTAEGSACVLDLTWPEAAPGWIEPLDSTFTCQEMIDQWRRNEQWPGERGGTMVVVDFGDGWYCTGVHWDPNRPPTNAVGDCDLNGRRFNVYQGEPGQRSPAEDWPTPTLEPSAPLPAPPTAPPSARWPSPHPGWPTCWSRPRRTSCAHAGTGSSGARSSSSTSTSVTSDATGARGPIVRLDATGYSRESSCRGDFFDSVSWPDPTPYGTTVKLGDISCDVEETGLTCTNLESHGFTLSRSGIKPF